MSYDDDESYVGSVDQDWNRPDGGWAGGDPRDLITDEKPWVSRTGFRTAVSGIPPHLRPIGVQSPMPDSRHAGLLVIAERMLDREPRDCGRAC